MFTREGKEIEINDRDCKLISLPQIDNQLKLKIKNSVEAIVLHPEKEELIQELDRTILRVYS